MKAFVLALLVGCATPAPHTSTPAPAPAPPPAPPPPPPAPTLEPVRAAPGKPVHPYALYIAKMHPSLHAQWADGVLAQLREIREIHNGSVQLELQIGPDGALRKVTIRRPSGHEALDSAALAAMRASAPFPETPAEVRSSDGNTYVRWTLYVDDRECSPANAEPFVLTAAQ